VGKTGRKIGQEFATLTDIITEAWSGKTVKQYKQFKELKKENLRDNMTNLELVLNMLAEATTTEISKEKNRKLSRTIHTLQSREETLQATREKKLKPKPAKKLSVPKMQNC
jgi:uncharacterized protein YukE